jgi:hypothetical protein
MAQINLRLDDNIVRNFHKFCDRYDIKGYTLLGMIVKTYAGAEELREKFDNGVMSKEDALLKLGGLMRELQQVSRINHEFTGMMADLTKKFGISLADLGFTEPVEKDK